MSYAFGYRVDEGIATVTFNRPDVLNALTPEVFSQFRQLLEELRHDDDVQVLVITGAGRGFCSGGDVHQVIGQLLDADVHDHLAFTRTTGAVVRNMRLLDKPIIAAVNGVAGGAGAVIALASDLRVASERASFAFMFTRVGLSGAEMGAAYLLPKVIGLGRAAEVLLLGETIDAPTAERYGLVNRVVPDDQVLPVAYMLARRLVEGPTLAIRMTKRRLVNEVHMDLVSALESEAEAQALLMMTADHRAYYEAFVGKTKPKFTGR